MSTAPGSVSDDRAVLINLGDPRRKNTLCVEITPATKEVSLGAGGGHFPVLITFSSP